MVFWRRKFAKMALPLHCNRIAVTVKPRCRYGVTATRLRRNGKDFGPETRQRYCQTA